MLQVRGQSDFEFSRQHWSEREDLILFDYTKDRLHAEDPRLQTGPHYWTIDPEL